MMKYGYMLLRKTNDFEIYMLGDKFYQFYYKTLQIKELKNRLEC